MSVQVIERNGKPEWAVLPYEEYLRLVEQAEMLEDIQDFDQVTAAVERGEEELIPGEIAFALAEGGKPVKIWPEFRHLTQQQVAGAVGISIPFLSQIETGKRKASLKTLARIARVLQVTVDDLLGEAK
jgi:DNA-binding XRE family transcriptional regulator